MTNDKNNWELKALLDVLPPRINQFVLYAPDAAELIEIVLDLGKPSEIRFQKRAQYIENDLIAQEDLDHIISKTGQFSADNRAGIERTLHRISAIRNRQGKVIGLTCRVGRSIIGTIDIIRDVIESGKNILFLGPPGIGKTTKLREAARVLSDEFGKRVVVVDTSNEIAGDSDIPHSGIGKARRMQVSSPDKQHAVMIEAVENHMPEVVIVDEIGTEAEALAARTIAERGVQLIGTAHGNTLDNILNNPTLSDLVGGIQTVILGDEEARRRGTQKAVLERKAPPTFDTAIEIQERDTFAIYPDVALAIDRFLRGKSSKPEIRVRNAEGKVEIREKADEMPELKDKELKQIIREKGAGPARIFLFGVNKGIFERVIRSLRVPAVVADKLAEADLVLTTKSKTRPGTKLMVSADEHNLPVHVIKKNTSSQINRFLKGFFKAGGDPKDLEEIALREAEDALKEVIQTKRPVDITPQNAYIRRLQHKLVEQHDLHSESIGEEPKRRVRIYPA